MLKVGDKAPAFDLEGSGGVRVTSDGLRGRFAVIVFYPKNNTPG